MGPKATNTGFWNWHMSCLISVKQNAMVTTTSNENRINQLKTYGELLKRPEWLKKRGEILKRDSNSCRICQNSKELQVHHKQYHVHKTTETKAVPWAYDNKYLLTLCKKCHEVGHKLYKIPTFII